MLGREVGNALVRDLHTGLTDGVTDREDARVKHADDISRIRHLNALALLRHHLLRLRKLDILAALHVEIFLTALKLARADTHKGDSVAVRFIHVGLDLEHERRESLVAGLDLHLSRLVRQGRGGHLQKALQEGLDTKVVERRAEEYGRELARADRIKVKAKVSHVQKLDLLG